MKVWRSGGFEEFSKKRCLELVENVGDVRLAEEFYAATETGRKVCNVMKHYRLYERLLLTIFCQGGLQGKSHLWDFADPRRLIQEANKLGAAIEPIAYQVSNQELVALVKSRIHAAQLEAKIHMLEEQLATARQQMQLVIPEGRKFK